MQERNRNQGRSRKAKRPDNRPPKKPRIDHNLIRELQDLRQRVPILEKERDSAVEQMEAVKKEAKADRVRMVREATKTVAEYAGRFKKLLDFVKKYQPQLVEKWLELGLVGEREENDGASSGS